MRQNLSQGKRIGVFILTLALIVGLYIPSFAQKSTELDVSDYFKKDTQWKPEIIAKFNVASLVIGDLGLSAEFLVGDVISFEVGASLLLPYFMEPFPIVIGTEGYLEREMGHGLMGQMRVYPSGYAPESFFYAFQYAYKDFSAYQTTVNQHHYSVIYGYQFHLSDKILADAGAGFGYRINNVSNPELYEAENLSFENDYFVSLSFKIGYFFF